MRSHVPRHCCFTAKTWLKRSGLAAENGTAHDADAADGAASPSRWMQPDAAEPDIGTERDIPLLGESVVKVSWGFSSLPLNACCC